MANFRIGTFLREIARSLRPILDRASELAGTDGRTAFAALTTRIYGSMDAAVREGMVVGGEVAEAEPAQQLAFADMDAVELAAAKAEFEALRLELARAHARGELVAITDLEQSLLRRIRNARTTLLAVPSRLAPLFQTLTPDEARSAVRRALEEVVSRLAGEEIDAAALKETLTE
jgi:hypothetical protein